MTSMIRFPSPERQVCLDLCRSIASGGDRALSLNVSRIDWETFKGITAHHEICPFMYPQLWKQKDLVPGEVVEYYRHQYFTGLAQCYKLTREFLRLSAEFNKRTIPMVPLKGIAFLFDIYRAMPSRYTQDIDIVIEECDIDKASDLLISMGYELRLDGLTREYWLQHQCHLQFVRRAEAGPIALDMHFGLDFKRESPALDPLAWKRTRRADYEGQSIELFAPEDGLFGLALHQRRFGKVLLLKNVLDCALLINRYSHELDWDYIVSRSHTCRVRACVVFLLLQTTVICNIPIPRAVCSAFRIHPVRKAVMAHVVKRRSIVVSGLPQIKSQYVINHFLLYDSLRESALYVVRIPLEQFAKFYDRAPYSAATRFRYRIRFAYIIWRLLRGFMANILKFA